MSLCCCCILQLWQSVQYEPACTHQVSAHSAPGLRILFRARNGRPVSDPRQELGAAAVPKAFLYLSTRQLRRMLRRTRWSPQIRERDTIGRIWRDREVQETGDSTYCLKELVLALSGHLHPALHPNGCKKRLSPYPRVPLLQLQQRQSKCIEQVMCLCISLVDDSLK